MCTDFIDSNKENATARDSSTIALLESTIMCDPSLCDWTSPNSAKLPLSLENLDLRTRIAALEDQLSVSQAQALSSEKQRLEREITLLTQCQQTQNYRSDVDFDPKDALITALRHQVIALRSDCKALERKLDRAVHHLPATAVPLAMDIWEEKGQRKADYAGVMRRTYEDLSQESTLFGLKSCIIRLLSALQSAEKEARTFKFKADSLASKLDFATSKATRVEQRLKQCSSLLDLSQSLNKRLFKALRSETHFKSPQFIRKMQGGRGRKAELPGSPMRTSRPGMVMTSPKGEGDQAVVWKVREMELQMQVLELNNTQLQDLLQEKVAESRASQAAEASTDSDLDTVRQVYEEELLRKEAQVQSLHAQLEQWVSKYMGLQLGLGRHTRQSRGDESPPGGLDASY